MWELGAWLLVVAWPFWLYFHLKSSALSAVAFVAAKAVLIEHMVLWGRGGLS